MIVPTGLYPETGVIFHHYKRHRAEARLQKIRERIADARIEEVKRGE